MHPKFSLDSLGLYINIILKLSFFEDQIRWIITDLHRYIPPWLIAVTNYVLLSFQVRHMDYFRCGENLMMWSCVL